MSQFRRLILIVFLCLYATPVSAEIAPPYVFFEPFAVIMAPGETAPLSVEMQDADQVIKVDVRIHFDPSVIEIVDADPAKDGVQVKLGVKPKPDLVVRNIVDNAGGLIYYAVMQLNPTPPASGDGTLFSFDVRAKPVASQFDLTFEAADITGADGSIVTADTESGNILVSPDAVAATETPTTPPSAGTATATASATATVTVQPQSTPTRTATPTGTLPPPTATASPPAPAAATATIAASPTPVGLAATPTMPTSPLAPAAIVPPAAAATIAPARISPVAGAALPATRVPAGAAATATRLPATPAPSATAGASSAAALASGLSSRNATQGAAPLDPSIGQPLALSAASPGAGALDSPSDALVVLGGVLMIVFGVALLVGTVIVLRRFGIV